MRAKRMRTRYMVQFCQDYGGDIGRVWNSDVDQPLQTDSLVEAQTAASDYVGKGDVFSTATVYDRETDRCWSVS